MADGTGAECWHNEQAEFTRTAARLVAENPEPPAECCEGEIEYGVGQRGRPGLHRGPWSEIEAREWIREAEDDGGRPGAFFLLRRHVSAWAENPELAGESVGLTDEQRDWLDRDNQGYYIWLDRTGVPEVDRILSAICYAGKAYHNTESWCDEQEGYDYGPIKIGMSPIDVIQAAARDAARSRLAACGTVPAESDGLAERVRALADEMRGESDKASVRELSDPNAYLRRTIYDRFERKLRALLDVAAPEGGA